jgi:hypothetical protein
VIVTADAELLYPLTLFCQNGGHPLPSFEVLDGEALPQPYRGLLVHHGDMTSRLEEFHGGALVLEVLHHEHTPTSYRREVVLRLETSGSAVEYGAIEIDLAAFDGELRQMILDHRYPLGGLLNRFGIQYRSEPKAFIKLGSDAVMQRVFALPGGDEFYGRCNLLLGTEDRKLARIVEVLRPVENTASYAHV